MNSKKYFYLSQLLTLGLFLQLLGVAVRSNAIAHNDDHLRENVCTDITCDLSEKLSVRGETRFLLTKQRKLANSLAETGFLAETRSTQIIFEENFEPPEEGEPPETASAGSRDDGLRCSLGEEAIIPLMPKRNYGLTLQEHPSIYMYLPKTNASQVLLVFRDEAGEYYQQTHIPITAKEGIVSFSLPDRKPPLTVGKNYQWSLAVICGEKIGPNDPVFRGWVQRVERTAALEKELEQKTTIEQASWYGLNGYWYDLLTAMQKLRQENPQDLNITKQWQKLLESVGFSSIASEPFLLEN